MRPASSHQPDGGVQCNMSFRIQIKIPARSNTLKYHQLEALAASARTMHSDAPILTIFVCQRQVEDWKSGGESVAFEHS
jgi:hypothetical protein